MYQKRGACPYPFNCYAALCACRKFMSEGVILSHRKQLLNPPKHLTAHKSIPNVLLAARVSVKVYMHSQHLKN